MKRLHACLVLVVAGALAVTGCPKRDDTETNCTDGADDDGDGLTDCADADCAANAACDLCGNGTCDTGESATSCPADCDSCGNDVCDPAEDVTTCPADCALACGDGTCDAIVGEDEATCPQDCAPSVRCVGAVALTAQMNALGGTFYDATGAINPAGAVLYYSFTAAGGDWWQLIASNEGAMTDPVIQLWSGDGTVLLAENDDAFPRLDTSSEIYHRFEAGGTYCLRVEEFSTWTDDVPVGGPAYAFRAVALPVDFTLYDEYTEDVEANDDAMSANPAILFGTPPTGAGVVLGDYSGTGDSDWFVLTPEPGVLSLNVDFTPSGGTASAYGSTADLGVVNLWDAAGSTLIASLDYASGADGLTQIPVVGGTSYTIEVVPPAGAAGSNDFYVFKMSSTDLLNEQELDDVANDLPLGAEAATPNANGMVVSYFIGGSLDASAGGDTDWWTFDAIPGDQIAVACASWRAGSGIRDAHFAMYGLDAAAGVLQEETEVETADLLWSNATGGTPSMPAVTTTETGLHHFAVSAMTQDPSVTSNFYICGIHVTTP